MTPQDEKFIKENYQKMSVGDLARKLKRGELTIRKFLISEGLKPKQKTVPFNHPFKKQNRGLERLLNYIKERA